MCGGVGVGTGRPVSGSPERVGPAARVPRVWVPCDGRPPMAARHRRRGVQMGYGQRVETLLGWQNCIQSVADAPRHAIEIAVSSGVLTKRSGIPFRSVGRVPGGNIPVLVTTGDLDCSRSACGLDRKMDARCPVADLPVPFPRSWGRWGWS